MPECPICQRVFPASQIERHANQCIDQMNEHPPEPPSPPLARTPSPPLRRDSLPTAPRRNEMDEILREIAALEEINTRPPAVPTARPRRRSGTPPAAMRRPASARTDNKKSGAAAPKSTTTATKEPKVVTDREVDELLDAIRIRDAVPAPAPAPVPTTVTASKSKTWTPSPSEFQPITGDIYVRIVDVELPVVSGLFSSARSPYVDVALEKETYTTAAPTTWTATSSTGHAAYADEEFFFSVSHYFGGAVLKFHVYERGLLSRSSCGQAEISATEIVHSQLAAFRKLGMRVAVDAAGHLAIGEEGGSEVPLQDPQFAGWFTPGVCPTALQLRLPLSGGAGGYITAQVQFIFASTKCAIGRRAMKPLHRAAAGGFVKLARFYWTQRERNMALGSIATKTKDNCTALDLAVQGDTPAHARCVSFLLHCINDDVEADGVVKTSADTLRKHASGLMCLALYNSKLTNAMNLTDAALSEPQTTVIHRAAATGSKEIFCMLLVPGALGSAKTRAILASIDNDGRTPFLVAAAHGNTAVLDALFTVFGPPQTTKTDSGKNDAIMLAAAGGHAATIKFLLSKGLPAEGRNNARMTALHMAANVPNAPGSLEAVRILVAAGAKPSVDEFNRRPVHYAVRAGNVESALELVQSGGDSPGGQDLSGNTAYDLALEMYAKCTSKQDAWKELLKTFERSMSETQVQAARNKLAKVASGAVVGTEQVANTGAIAAEEAAPLTKAGPLVKPPMLGAANSRQQSTSGGVKSVSIWQDDVACDDDYVYQDNGDAADAETFPSRPPAFGLQRSTSSGAAAPPPVGLARQRSVEVYNVEEVVDLHTRMLNDIAALLKVPLSTAGSMLLQYKWDAQALTDAFYADSNRVFEKCGVMKSVDGSGLEAYREGKHRAEIASAAKSSAKPKYKIHDGKLVGAVVPEENPADAPDFCPACMEEVPGWKLVSLGCGHVMCSQCWSNHCAAALEEHGKDVSAKGKCPDPSCKLVIPEEFWKELAAPKVADKYRQFVLRSFVPLTGQVVWCPNPKCTKALRYKNVRSDLTCSCGMRFCVSCQLEAHSPCSCEEYHQWRDDSEGLKDVLTMRVLMENYKKCPRCGIYMERTQGCNHITCKCGHQWCFMCKGDWSTHGSQTGGYFRCNIHETNKSKKQVDWEGYTEEERARYLGDSNQSRAKLFEETQAKVKTQEDGMQMAEHKLHVTRKAASDPSLLLKKHGIKVAAAAAANASRTTAKAAVEKSSSIHELLKLRKLVSDGITALAEAFGRIPEEDDTPSAGAGAVAARSPLASPSEVDPLTEHILKQEAERLAAIAAAFEALYEFHRVEKWCHVHLFYTAPGKSKVLLEHKQSVLEEHASNLYEMLTSSAKLATLDAAAVREYSKAVRKFSKNLLDEVEEENAMKGRSRGMPPITSLNSGAAESKSSS